MFTDEQCSGLTVHMKEVLVPGMTVFAEVGERRRSVNISDH